VAVRADAEMVAPAGACRASGPPLERAACDSPMGVAFAAAIWWAVNGSRHQAQVAPGCLCADSECEQAVMAAPPS
jgi:hypothetical protein